MVGTRTFSLKFLLATLVLLAFSSSQAASFGSGITYSGRIVKDENPIDSGTVRFFVWIQTQGGCDLYAEQRDVDMTGSAGTYAFEIGNGAMASSFPHTSFGIKTIADVFDNTKKTSDLDTSRTGCLTFTPNSDEGRVMKVQFIPPGEVVAQALPDLVLTAVPTAQIAFNATKVNGYGTGDLLKVDPAYTAKTTPNNPLTAAQYEEFWKLILGTSTTYLKAIPTLGGDVTGTLPAMTVVKIQNVAVTAPTTGDTGKVLTYNGTGMVWSSAAAGGITSLNGLSGTTQSFDVGNSGTDFNISSSGSGHTFNIPTASSSNRGLLSTTDWTAFNGKQSSALGSGQVWIGNASGAAQAQTLSGDATVSASGNVTVDKTQAAAASKILQLDSSGNAYVAGVDIKGTGTGEAQLRFTGATDMVMNLPTTSGSANQFLQTDGAGNLSWASQSAMLPAITAGQVWVGNSSNGAQAFTLSGDIASVSNTGLVTLSTSATGSNKLPLAGGTMSGAIAMGGNNISNAGDISLAAGKFLGLGAGSTAGTVAGQVWYDGGIIKYFDGTTTQSLGVAGAGITNLNGLSAGTQSFVNGFSGTTPAFSSAGSAHTLNIPMASSASVTAGLISNADYASMMAKQSGSLAAGQVWVGNASGVAQAFALSGDISSVSNTGSVVVNKTTTGQANYILALDGSGIANVKGLDVQSGTGKVTFLTNGAFTNYTLTLPNASPAANQIMKSDASGNLSWVTYLANVSDSAPLTNGKMWIGNASGIASEVTMSGDATITNAGLLSLKNTGTVGTYTKVITDAQGRVTSGSALASGDVTTALGYTPASSTNGYINGGNTFAGNGTIGLKDNYNLGILTNNTTKMTITSGGNVGIGTATPRSILHAAGTNGVLSVENKLDPNVGVFYGESWNSGQLGLYNDTASAWGVLAANTQQVFFGFDRTGKVGSLTNLMGDTPDYRNVLDDGSGKVGIGIAAPTVSLDMSAKTDGILLPKGTSAQRPANAVGLMRYNTSNNNVEYNDGSGWSSLATSSGSTGAYVNGGNSFGVTANLGTNDNNDLNIKTNNMTRFSFLKTGEMGVSPAAGGANFQINDAGMEISRQDSWPEFTMAGYGNSGGNYWTPQINLTYARGTRSSPTYALSGDTLGALRSSNHTNGLGAFVRFDATQTHTASASGTKISLVTVPNGSNIGNVAMSLAQDGKVAIGSSAPSYSLDMQDWTDAIRMPSGTTAQRPTNAAGLLRYNTTNSNVEFNNGSGWSALATSSGSTGAFVNGGNAFSGNATIGLNDAFNLGFKTNNTTKMTLTSDGKLGIGTAAPNTALTIASGDITLDAGYSMMWGQSAYSFINGDSGPSSHLILGTSGAIVMTLDVNGNVGIGTNPSFTLDMGSRTDAARLPQGTTAQRPANTKGIIRYNTSTDTLEYNNGSSWTTVGSAAGMSNALAAGQMWVGNASGVAQAFALSGDVSSVSNTGSVTVNKTTTGANNTILSLDGSGVANAYGFGVKGATSGTVTLQAATTTANYSLKLPATTPAVNQVMQSDASGNLSWVNGVTTSTGYINGGNTFAGNATIGLNDAYTLGFKTSNATRMTLDASGNLGVGTATPKGTLHIGNTSVMSAAYAPLVVGNSSGSHIGMDSSTLQAYANATTTDTLYLNFWGGDIFFGDGTNAKFDRSLNSIVLQNGGNLQVLNAGTVTTASGNIYTSTGKIGAGGNPTYSIDAGANTDAIRLPRGTDAQRPANAAGLFRYNTTSNVVEFNNGSAWTALSSGGTNPIVKDGNSFGAHLIIGTNDNYDFRFEANGATAMTIEPSGEVGIGTTTPGYKLDIASTDGSAIRANTYSATASQGSNVMLYRGRGTASSTTAVQANDTLGGVYARGYGATSFGSASTSYMEFSAAQTFTDTKRGSYMTFFTTPNDSTTPTERMRIAQNGNVGIGTNNPGFTLEVASNIVDPNYATMQVTNTNATSTWTPVIAAMAPNAQNGAAIQMVYGVGPTNGNRVEETFAYHSDANSLNSYSLGFYGKNDLFTVMYGGNIGFGTAGPDAGVQIGESAASTTPRQLFIGETKTSGTQRPQIIAQWNSNGLWGIGPTTTAVNDFRVKIGYVSAVNSDWDSSQKISLDVDGPVVSAPQAVTGATVNLAASNTITISAIGSSTITLQNMVHGGNYTLLVSDTTSRTYTFSGCNTSKFKPANTATVSGTSTMYNIITVYNGSTYDCWITWASGYQ